MSQRLLAIGLGALSPLLAGCAVAARVVPIQTFVNEASRMHGQAPATVVIAVRDTLAAYYSDTRAIQIHPRILDSYHLWAVVAHEAAHHVLGHNDVTCAPTQRIRCEQDATATGVSLLVAGRHIEEAEALATMYWMLLAQHVGSPEARPEYAAPCDDIKDLLGRFPQHRALWQSWECAPAAVP